MASSNSSSDSTSRSLLRRARERDAAAWEKLTAVYAPLVYQWCRRSKLQASDAAEVTQEVFISVSRGIESFRKVSANDSFRGWLWTITRNKINDHFRNAVKHPNVHGGSTAHIQLQQLPDQFASVTSGDQVLSQLAKRAVAVMQTDFEESTWRAFWMTAVDQLPPKDVADELGMTRDAVYKAKSRVLRHLREELTDLDLID